MRTLTLTGEKTALLIGATGIRSIEQNIRMILTTFMYSVPLDLRFRARRQRRGHAVPS